MASEKTDALVLRLVEWSETSLIVTMLTRDFGKTAAVAKGARRPKSSFEGALDLLAVCRVEIIPKSGDALDLLTEAKLEKRFRAGSKDLSRLYAGYYVAELLRELTDSHDPNPELFDLATTTLRLFDGDTDIRACLLRFELVMLRLLGHAPSLDACSGCGTSVPLDPSGRVAFGFSSGGVLCNACRPSARGIIVINDLSRQWMRETTAQQQFTGPPKPLPEASYGELRGLVNRFISDLAGSQLRLTPYLSNLKQGSDPAGSKVRE